MGHDDCPVCRGKVTRDNVIPIYGADSEAKDPREQSTQSSRPHAHYQESDHTVLSPFFDDK